MNLIQKLILSVIILVLKLSLQNKCVHGKAIYTAVSPPYIYPQSEYIIRVFFSGTDQTELEYYSAHVNCGRFNYNSTAKLNPDGKPTIVSVSVGKIQDTGCNLTLITTTQGGTERTEKTTRIRIGREDFLLIHTDKPIYKPKDKVQFRVILLDRHGKPKSGRIDIRVRDSQRNLVKLWSNVTSDNFGVFRDNLELSYEPNLGKWTIEANTQSSRSKQVSFDVREYVLPTVNVEVELPDFGIIDEFPTDVPISVKAKYTYGESVKGMCDVNVTLFSKDCKGGSRRDLKSTSFSMDGIASQNIDVNPRIIAKVKNGSKVEFRVTVTEAVTNRKYVKEIFMPLLKYSYQIKAVEKLSYHRHGLPYIVDFQILNRKNELIRNSGDTVIIEHNFQEGVAPYSVPVKDGIVSCNFTETNTDGDQRFIKITYKSFVLRYVVPERMKDYRRISATKDALVIELLPRSSINQQMKVLVKSTTALQSVNYLIVSYQKIVSADTVQLKLPSKSYLLTIPVLQGLSSDATIYVFTYIDEDYIGDFVNIQKSFDPTNTLKLILSSEKVEPGKNMSLKIEAKPESLITLRAIDQSVLLLAADSDLTKATVQEEYRGESYQNGNKLPFDLKRSGLVVITNANESPDHIARFERDPLEDVCTSPRKSGSETQEITSVGEVVHRSDFPETWLWEEVQMGSSNYLNKSFTAPDTLTSWIISGYSLNPQFGIEFLSKSEKLTTFKQFFITLDLPYSVVKDEQLLLKILVHNYLPGSDSRQVSVKLSNTNYGFILGKSSNGGENEKSINCDANSVCSVNFVIIPSRIGQLMLEIQARTTDAGDGVTQSLLVTPPGEKVVVTESKVFQNSNLESNGSVPGFKIYLPADRVQGGDSIKLTFSSDILSSAMDHLENLLELPTGCGEQNMFLFVNNLVVLRYLNATNRLTQQVREKAVKFLVLGYQRQLTFRTPSGSFSTFQNDTIGSTSLTAFVIRYFLASRHIISIDEDVITKGLEFLETKLIKARPPKGILYKFVEDGHVNVSKLALRKDTKGVLLTAYCTLTFLEAYEKGFGNLTILEGIISKGRSYWDSYGSTNLTGKNYDIEADIMLTYADYAWNNVKGNSSVFRGKEYFVRVQKHATALNMDLKHFEINKEDLAVAVEMTSYVLLTYLYRNETHEALPLVRWLLQQQNANGGFYSTKDTIIGLSALAKYAEMTYKPHINLQVEVSHFENDKLVSQPDKHVVIMSNNATLLHEIIFPPNTTHVQVKTTGTGTLYTQVSWSYHVDKRRSKKDFEIRVIKFQIDDVPGMLGLRICTKYTGKAKSNMAIIEVNLPSGYIFDPEALNDLRNVTHFKRQELKHQNKKLDIYFDFIPKDPETCIYVEAMRSFKVGKTSSAIVRVYDYYETSRKAMESYTVPEVNFCEICKDTRDCDQQNCVD